LRGEKDRKPFTNVSINVAFAISSISTTVQSSPACFSSFSVEIGESNFTETKKKLFFFIETLFIEYENNTIQS
jgi:hypothetical protein